MRIQAVLNIDNYVEMQYELYRGDEAVEDLGGQLYWIDTAYLADDPMTVMETMVGLLKMETAAIAALAAIQ